MFLKVKNQIVGEVRGDEYVTIRNYRKHYLRIARGYPISVSILKQLKEMGINKIRIIEKFSKKEYTTTVDKYIEGELFQFRGYDAQKVITLDFAKCLRNNVFVI